VSAIARLPAACRVMAIDHAAATSALCDRFAAASRKRQREQTLGAIQPQHPYIHGDIRSVGMA
jgi:hypothetical protein